MSKILKRAFIDALATAVYIVIIGFFFYFAEAGIFGQGKSILIPIAMLMLFVFSAALTGSLVFGAPVVWYIDGKRKEALKLLIHTLGMLLTMTLIFFISLALFFGR